MQEIALCDLKPSKNNVRKTKSSEESLKYLIASIQHNDLLKNLIVSKNGKGYCVIDGNRRLEALKTIHGEESPVMINCLVVDPKRNEQNVGLHANMMHENMHPMDECEAIEMICKEGFGDYDSIASQFGRTEKWVLQRVKLASLSPLAKEQFRAMEFGISVAEALTMGNHKDQDRVLKEYKNREISVDRVHWSLNGNKIEASLAVFDITGHEEDLGVEKDLFSEDVWITNHSKFEELTANHLNEIVEARKQKKFKGILLLNDITEFEAPSCKNLTKPDKRAKDTDTILVIRYMPRKGEIAEIRMIEKPVEEKKPTGSVDSEGKDIDIPQETPYEYSNPQSFMLRHYYNDFMRSHVFNNMDQFDHAKFGMATICAYHHLGRDPYSNTLKLPGSGSFSNENKFNQHCEVPKDDYTPDYEQALVELCDKADEASNSRGISTFEYYYTLDDAELNRIFGILAIRSCSAWDFETKEFQTIYKPQIDKKKWFRPFENWLAKYNLPRLLKLYSILTGKKLSPDMKKKDAIKEVKGALDNSGSKGFNPFKK